MAELVYDVDSFVAECIKYRSKIEVSILTLAEIAATKWNLTQKNTRLGPTVQVTPVKS